MGYKQNKSIIQGTDGHKSALKSKKAFKKVAGKILKKVGSKFLGPVGIGLGVVDAISIAGHSYDKGSLKEGIKKWWDSPGFMPTKPKFKRENKKVTSKPTPKPSTGYEQSYTKEVANKWKDKGGKAAYIKAAKEWNAKNKK